MKKSVSSKQSTTTPTTKTEPRLRRIYTASSRPSIDHEQRAANRALRPADLLARLRAEAPEVFPAAEIVGQWVWVIFTDKQPPTVTARLSQLGFHWNNKRQVWQHPCGHSNTKPNSGDPREKYGTLHAADYQPV